MNTFTTPINIPVKGIRGPMLTFRDDPFLSGQAEDCYDYCSDGLIVVGGDGKIVARGDYASLRSEFPDLTDIDVYGQDSLILPGFIDAHVHYVQSPMIASYGDTLVSWLGNYAFPTEIKFSDKAFADDVARMFFRQILSHGTTTANVFSTTFATSVDAFFEESERYGTRMISGKVLQDRNLPELLRDKDAESSVEISEALLRKWHGRGRQMYAVIPRFAPTSTPDQLRLAGELYQRYISDGVYMHTHLDEAADEIRWALSLYPESSSYTDIYDRFGLVGRRSVFAHCCILRPEEWRTLHRNGCGVVTCPSSNLFLGDGEFKYWEAKNPEHPCRTGVGTDVGGGTSFSVVRQLGEMYKVAMLEGHAPDAIRSFYLATRGGAEALHLENTVGALDPGCEADIAVLDLESTEFMSWRMRFAETLAERLFILQTLAPDNMCRATYSGGMKVYDRDKHDRFAYRV